MKKPNIPTNESLRLEALKSYNILDSLPEDSFDELTKLAAEICGTPIALVSLIDSDRQWFKSRYGIDATETPRDVAFCAHAINQKDTLLVSNANVDQRFFDNPLVTAGPNVKFYCGAQLFDENGFALGTLCVIDHQPKIISESQIRALEIIGRQVMVQIRLRRQLIQRDIDLARITESESVLRSQAQSLIQASKLAALGEMASGIAHEINNPLAIISGLACQLKRRLRSHDRDLKQFETSLIKIDDTIKRISDIVSQLLVFASRSNDTYNEEIAISLVVDQTLALCSESIKAKGIEVRLSGNLELILSCRPMQMSQVLLSLLHNACDACEHQTEKWIEISAFVGINSSGFSVTDSGPGIAKEVQDRIFEPFATTKFSNCGNGLGLSVAHGIVNSHGGSIKLDQTSQRTRFIIELPLKN